jgi:transcriptional regulator with XRE-family HTH domain
MNMVKLSELRAETEIHEQDLRDAEYRLEVERTQFANDVAIKVIQYRVRHGLSQAELAGRLGMRQPNLARLESGEHEPSLSTLARLSLALGLDFSVEVKAGALKLRYPVRRQAAQTIRPARSRRKRFGEPGDHGADQATAASRQGA